MIRENLIEKFITYSFYYYNYSYFQKELDNCFDFCSIKHAAQNDNIEIIKLFVKGMKVIKSQYFNKCEKLP